MSDEFRAWKDENLRDELDAAAPANPAGSIDLSAIHGGVVVGPITTLPCATAVTAALSCWLGCNSFWRGSCGVLSVGCC